MTVRMPLRSGDLTRARMTLHQFFPTVLPQVGWTEVGPICGFAQMIGLQPANVEATQRAEVKLAHYLRSRGAGSGATKQKVIDAFRMLGADALDTLKALPADIRAQILYATSASVSSESCEDLPITCSTFDQHRTVGRHHQEVFKSRRSFGPQAEYEQAAIQDHLERFAAPFKFSELLLAKNELVELHPGLDQRERHDVIVTEYHDKIGHFLGASFAWKHQGHRDADTHWWVLMYDPISKTIAARGYFDASTSLEIWER